MHVNMLTGEMGGQSGSPTFGPGTYTGDLCVADGTTDNAAAINAAVQSCPDGQYVYFPAGEYRLDSQIFRQGPNVENENVPFSIIIRGAGSDPVTGTRFKYHGASSSFLTFTVVGPINSLTKPVVSGVARGSTQIVIGSSSPYIGPNMAICVRRDNDDSGLIAGVQTHYDSPANVQLHVASQMVRVTSVVGGTTINFTPALNEDYPAPTIMFGYSFPYRCGLEDFYVEVMQDTNKHTMEMFLPVQCWVKNVHSKKAGRWHVHLASALECEVRECYFEGAWTVGGDHGYGAGLYTYACNNLVENNRMKNLRHAIIVEFGGQANVFGYNYSHEPVNDTSDYLTEDMDLHGGSPRFNLFEGNVGSRIALDRALGGSDRNTFFRNQVTRKSSAGYVVGNFGTDIQMWQYEAHLIGNCYEAPPGGYNAPGYVLTGDPLTEGMRRWGTNQDDNSVIDADSEGTTFLHGEYDINTDTLNWDSGTADHDLPNSFYLTSQPSWWDGGVWPAVGPDLADKFGENPAYRTYHDSLIGGGGSPTYSVGRLRFLRR